MIYERVAPATPIRQGDIFRDLPRVDVSLEMMTVIAREDGEAHPVEQDWLDALTDKDVVEVPEEENSPRFVRAVLPLAAVNAIVITQDCDALQDEELSFCEIGLLPEIWKQIAQVSSLKKYADMLTRQGSDQIKFFYLPSDEEVAGFSKRMAVDFSSVLRLPRTELEALKQLRIGRLNDEAYQHFREKLSEYFRRYPVDPWYSLSKEEFEEYAKNREGVSPRPWQE